VRVPVPASASAKFSTSQFITNPLQHFKSLDMMYTMLYHCAMSSSMFNHYLSITAPGGNHALSMEGNYPMFNKVDSSMVRVPGSSALDSFVRSFCPSDAHIHVTMRGLWTDGNERGFFNRSMSSETTGLQVVRSFSCKGITYWTLEKWEHDNGYRCTLVVLSKAEFLSLIS
jgi:hypothetical protein